MHLSSKAQLTELSKCAIRNQPTQIGNAAIPLNWHTILESSEITKGIVQPSKITSRKHLYNPEAKKSKGSEVKSEALIQDQEALHRNSRRRRPPFRNQDFLWV
jgi:hypothetical protein